jgi:hypothetical protein
MKNFIEVPQKEGNILINVNHIAIVEPLVFNEERQYTLIYMSSIQRTEISDVRQEDVPPSKLATSDLYRVDIPLPYTDVRTLIEDAL